MVPLGSAQPCQSAILTGEQTLEYLVAYQPNLRVHDEPVFEDISIQRISSSDDRVTPRRCSVDLVLEHFTDMRGRSLQQPVILRPKESIVGYTSLAFFCLDDAFLSVETRSRAARHGLVCRGFYDQSYVRSALTIGDSGTRLAFMLRNYSPNALLVPSSPLQITAIRKIPLNALPSPLRIMRDGVDVTAASTYCSGLFSAYTVGLDEKLCYLQKTTNPLDINEDNSRYLIAAAITDIVNQKINPGFFLANTAEEIHNNGCPAYMYPFHFRDLADERFTTPSFHAVLMRQFFNTHSVLPVTANAGLLNPGTKGTVVYECLTRGRDLANYFHQKTPFGFIIPMPFYDGSLDTSCENGTHGPQKVIGF